MKLGGRQSGQQRSDSVVKVLLGKGYLRTEVGNIPKIIEENERNIYRRARKKAALRNERFGSMASASEQLIMAEQTLQGYETYAKHPCPETVVMMADTYGTPELLPQYCATECPIGRARGLPTVELQDICKTSIQTLAALQQADNMGNALLEVVKDGRIDPEEREIVSRIISWIEELNRIGQELKAAI